MPVYATILVLTDGSSCSERAVQEAGRLATALAAEVTVLSVVDTFASLQDGIVDAAEIVERGRADAKAGVARALAMLRDAGAVAQSEVAEGNVVEESLRRAAKFDLLVIGSHGKGLMRRLLLGSVAQNILQRSRKPVLVINVVQ